MALQVSRTRAAILVILPIGLLLFSNIGAAAGASSLSRADYASIMAQHPAPSNGCFVSTYPDTTWKEERFVSNELIQAQVRNGIDHPANNNTAHFGSVLGDFSSVSGITSETDS